ncbi:hypothetical protein [Mycolicibacterium moriokaense]|jgi:hypothetical protein|uniref:Uncharacterized protein n=1 Tax=Mycolicibacterium moriokaense TaxID=39691 RepID=A0AAD1M465_9MYCO|nr:hypothetical protein [Mycolicibacterium moriokaense]MCV7037661.1 hypothetical protein [Mycolicibacterium moriokaense]BBW99400.1 hypothetical protein MMOR_03370 [Mycolicibacterium moriokaense]
MTTRFDRRVTRRAVHPRPVLYATTARTLLAHLAATLVLGVVALVAVWQFMFDGAIPHHAKASSHMSSAPH